MVQNSNKGEKFLNADIGPFCKRKLFKMVYEPVNVKDNQIRILESGQTKWDLIRQSTQSGEQGDAFLVIDLDDIIRKHREWKLILYTSYHYILR